MSRCEGKGSVYENPGEENILMNVFFDIFFMPLALAKEEVRETAILVLAGRWERNLKEYFLIKFAGNTAQKS